ncbi:hypothetical protein HRbin12_00297 [bacterium HR12]|nr:hypothetical protein HRbin12_00297 [bacterium HR12]
MLCPSGSKTLPVYAYRTPLRIAISRARRSVDGGVGGRSSILKSGWNAVKCIGTSGPRRSTTQRVMASISSSESLRPGMRRLVSSTQTSVSCTSHSIVSSTGRSSPRHTSR